MGIFVVGVVFVLRSTGGPDEGQSVMDWGKKWRGTVMFAWCLVILLALLTPSRNDIVFIVGGSKLLEISRGDTASRLGSKTLSIVEKYLDGAASSSAEEVKQ